MLGRNIRHFFIYGIELAIFVMLSTVGLSGQRIKSYLLIRVGFLIFTAYPVPYRILGGTKQTTQKFGKFLLSGCTK